MLFITDEYILQTATGNLTITTIKKKKGDSVYDLCAKTTGQIIDLLTAEIQSNKYQTILGIDNTDALFMLLYYELRIAIVKELELKDLAGKAIFYNNPEDITPADIGNMIFKISSN